MMNFSVKFAVNDEFGDIHRVTINVLQRKRTIDLLPMGLLVILWAAIQYICDWWRLRGHSGIKRTPV